MLLKTYNEYASFFAEIPTRIDLPINLLKGLDFNQSYENL